MKSCCCNGGGTRWLAELCCDSSCVGNCPNSEETCICAEGITFCDEFRAAQGMPARMDPTLCYWWFHNGCRYRVLGTDNAPCVAIEDTPHNEGTYGGATQRLPNDPFCSETCADLCQGEPTYQAQPAPWQPGCGCGNTKTVTFDANGAKCCGCTCSAPQEACARTCPNATISATLQTWPMGWILNSAGCTAVVPHCESCIPNGNPAPIVDGVILDNLIGSNYCDDNCTSIDPCTGQADPDSPCEGGAGKACTAFGQIQFSLQGNPNDQYVFGFSVTRSCPEGACDTPPSWVFGGPTSGTGNVPSIALCDCSVSPCKCCAFFALDYPGSNAFELARVINQTLGGSQQDCVSYNAEGVREAWLANSWACIADNDGTFPSTNPCHECLFGPTVWIGPFFSSCNQTATWLYKNTYVYQLDCSYSCSNRTSFNANNQRCMCTGSDFGGVGETWSTGPMASAEFKYGVCPQFTTPQPQGNAPCFGQPSVS